MDDTRKRTAEAAGLGPEARRLPTSLIPVSPEEATRTVEKMCKAQAKSGRRAATKAILQLLLAKSDGKCWFQKDEWDKAANLYSLEKTGMGSALALQDALHIIAKESLIVFVNDNCYNVKFRASHEDIAAAKKAMPELMQAAELRKRLIDRDDLTDVEQENLTSAVELIAKHIHTLSFMYAAFLVGKEAVAYALVQHAADFLPPHKKGQKDSLKNVRQLIMGVLNSEPVKIAHKKDRLRVAAQALSQKLGWDQQRTPCISRMVRDVEWTDREDPDKIVQVQELELKIKYWAKSNRDQQLHEMEQAGIHMVDGAPSKMYTLLQNHPDKKGINAPRCHAYNKVGDSRVTLETVSFFDMIHSVRSTADGGEMARLPAGQYIVQSIKLMFAGLYDRVVIGGFLNSIDGWVVAGNPNTESDDIDADEAEQDVY